MLLHVFKNAVIALRQLLMEGNRYKQVKSINRRFRVYGYDVLSQSFKFYCLFQCATGARVHVEKMQNGQYALNGIFFPD